MLVRCPMHTDVPCLTIPSRYQRTNEFDLGGHARRAKELLVEASEEIKQAALAANGR